ncbi:transmembrane 136-like, partial [Olea europaea subsp. europaea]
IQTLAVTVAYLIYDLVCYLFDKRVKLDNKIHHLVSIVGLVAGLAYQRVIFSEQYKDRARKFVELTRETLKSEMIGCPCIKCRNLKRHNYEIVYEHLIIKGMDPTYTNWVFYGEMPSKSNLVDVEMVES